MANGTDQARTEQLGTLKSRLVLTAYEEPATPSEVARALRMPANTVHYWTRKLEEGGLLEEVDRDGRSRRFRTTPAAAAAASSGSGVDFARKIMATLGQLVTDEVEARELRGEDDSQLPGVEMLEVDDLASDSVGALFERFQGKIAAAQAGADEEAYTIALVVTPGRVSERF